MMNALVRHSADSSFKLLRICSFLMTFSDDFAHIWSNIEQVWYDGNYSYCYDVPSFNMLHHFSSLKELHMQYFSLDSISGLSQLFHLEHLCLSKCTFQQGSSTTLNYELSSLTKLKRLALVKVSGSCWDESFTSISSLTKLKELMIQDCGGGATLPLSCLSSLILLENLELRAVGFGDSDHISSLSFLVALKSLSIDFTYVQGNISTIGLLTNLTSLQLGESTRLHGDISCFSTLLKLERLRLCNLPEVRGDIHSLDFLADMTSVYLSGTAIAPCRYSYEF
jgi:hypothetical protein